jgi:hypothetical protein
VLKVHQAMKGRNSENEFLRHFPDLHMKHYQGSLKSTSEGIEKVFTKAREFLDDFHDQDKQEEYLSLISKHFYQDGIISGPYIENNVLKDHVLLIPKEEV